MLFSFQCILIPNAIAKRFADWFRNDCVPNNLFPEYVSTGKCDDSLFREYTMAHEQNVGALNIFPNVADHIDYLIGGTVINKHRLGEFRKSYWRDNVLDDAVRKLEEKLKQRETRYGKD